MKVKSLKAKALDTLNFPVPSMTMQMSEVASSVGVQASALITHSTFIRTGGKPFVRTRHTQVWLVRDTLLEYQRSLMFCSER